MSIQKEGDRSIEHCLDDARTRFNDIAPAGPSLWQIVQLLRDDIVRLRTDGATWAQIAEALRAAGFPGATESNVRLAHQSGTTTKVKKSRRRIDKSKAAAQQGAAPINPLPPRPSQLLGETPRLLKRPY